MRQLRILVVDDEVGARDCMARLLRHQGYDVDAVPNADEALAVSCFQLRYDVILVDLIMPSMAGLRLIQEFQSRDDSLRFVVVSGKLLSVTERINLAAMGVQVCTKPFHNEELFQAVRAAVAQPEVACA